MYAAAAASVALARLGLIGAGQVILTSTSWMPAPEGCTTASPLPAADSARSVQDAGAAGGTGGTLFGAPGTTGADGT